MSGKIEFGNKSKAAVLASLYNNSKPHGFGIFNHVPGEMTEEHAARMLKEDHNYVDFLNGRTIKADFRQDSFDPYLYDRELGEGAAKRAYDLA